jgi:hypothetical protein
MKLFHPAAVRAARGLRAPWILFAAALLAGIGGCGGGGVGSGGTGGFASGTITGFGSVIVNGVRFDDAAARVEDGDGGGRSRDELRLGMTVEIESGSIANGSASASRIRFESELVGPVGVVNTAGGSFTMLGQRVDVDGTTVFDDRLAGGLDGLRAGDMVEVYAVFDPAADRYRATRVEPASGSAVLRLRGLVAQVDTTAQTLRIGSTSYGYAGAGNIPASLAAGQFVRLRLGLATAPLRWVVQSFGVALRELPEGDAVEIKGLISAYTSPQSFRVNGYTVDGSAAGFSDGTAGLGLGVRVEVEGTVRNGVLRASQVSIESDDEERDRGFELHGSISAVDIATKTFVLRGLTVSTARPDLRYDDGVATDVKVGARVEVRGQLSADRRQIEATRIKFE